jgi:DNA-binding Lrp family transcriptional regulator
MNENEDVKGRDKRMKDVELRLISELMKNSCRSDRELAKRARFSGLSFCEYEA